MNRPDIKSAFVHNDVAITLESNGRFSAMGPNGRVTSNSLDGIKKQLDKLGTFKTFKAFTIRGGYYGSASGVLIQDCTVVGVIQPRHRYGSPEWKLEKNGGVSAGVASEVYLDTPANRAAAKAYAALVAEHKKVREKQDEAESKALAKITSVRPEKKEK